MAVEDAIGIMRDWRKETPPRHLISATDFYPGELDRLFQLTDIIKEQVEDGDYLRHLDYLPRNFAVRIFTEEASTRTKDSMEMAAELLGATVKVESNGTVSSGLAKLEVRRSMLRMWQQFGYKMVGWRAADENAFDFVAEDPKIKLSLINLGDGANQHPTQFLLDAYTIMDQRRKLGLGMEGMTIVIAGMPRSRVTQSWMDGFAKQFPNNTFHLVSHPDLLPAADKLDDLERSGLTIVQSDDLLEAVQNPRVDFVCGTRYQAQHDPKYADIADLKERVKVARVGYQLHKTDLSQQVLNAMPDKAFYMHPLPSGDEFPQGLWNHPKVLAFDQQPRAGLLARMALILRIADSQKADELLG